MNGPPSAYRPGLSLALGAMLLAESAAAASQSEPEMVPIGKIDRASLGDVDIEVKATSPDGSSAPVRLDGDSRVLVPAGFRGTVDFRVGEQRAQVVVNLGGEIAGFIPSVLSYPTDVAAVANCVLRVSANYDMAPLQYTPPSRPSSKRGARAASGGKPWQKGGWRTTAARPGRR